MHPVQPHHLLHLIPVEIQRADYAEGGAGLTGLAMKLVFSLK
jgi:hypothetical protein